MLFSSYWVEAVASRPYTTSMAANTMANTATMAGSWAVVVAEKIGRMLAHTASSHLHVEGVGRLGLP